MKNCNYRCCGKELHSNINQNCKYCGEDCYMREKLERSKEDYSKKKNTILEIARVEPILRFFYLRYENKEIPAQLLIDQNMNWSICTGITIVQGFEVKQIGSYCYALFQNEQIKIWKL